MLMKVNRLFFSFRRLLIVSAFFLIHDKRDFPSGNDVLHSELYLQLTKFAASRQELKHYGRKLLFFRGRLVGGVED